MSVIELVVRRPVATLMITIAFAVFGLVSYGRLPLSLMPDLSYPTITVRTEVPGYAPEEVESQVSRPVEEALATTEGLQELESRSRAGMSDVVLEFSWGTDMDDAAQSIRERLQVTFLPSDASRPLILRYDPSLDPILRIAVAIDPDTKDAPKDEAALYLLREVAEHGLKRELEAMDGIAAVQVRGGLEREVTVDAHQDWLAARGITVQQLIQTLGSENVNVPGGAIREGEAEYMVRTLNEIRSVEEIAALEIRRPDGIKVPVSQVATVSESHKDREVVSLLDGREAVELEVYKAADANVVTVARDLKAVLGLDGNPGLIARVLPDEVHLVVLDDQAEFIESALQNLKDTAQLGALLAVAVLFLFLRDFRATAIIGTAIPLSIVCTFAPLYLGGVSLNLMSLGGLALGVGMLVDNAVVVLENIQVQKDAGKGLMAAAIDGSSEVAAAVIASTLTTVCVFLPIAFVEGVAGQVFGDLALTVVFSLLASLAVALFFVPMLAALDLHLPGQDERPRLFQIGRATRFRSFAQLKADWGRKAGLKRLLWLPYGLGRFGLRLAFELLVTVIVLPLALLFRLLAAIAGLVLPRLARLAMWAGNRFHDFYDRFSDGYGGAIAGLLKRPGLVLGLAALSVAISFPIGASLGQALIPEVHQGRFTAELALPVGTPLGRTVGVVRGVEGAVRKVEGVAHVHTVVGTERRADSKPDEGEHTARLTVELTPGGDLERREERVMNAVRDAILATRGDAELDVRMSRPGLFSARTPVEVLVFDNDLDHLRLASGAVRDRLASLKGLEDVKSSLVAGYPEVRIRYDRDLLARFGLDTGSVAARIKEKVQGEQATTLARGDGRIDLIVRLAEDERRSLDDLRRINVNPNLNPPIPLESVAHFDLAEGPSEIRRVDQRRAAAVTANIEGFDLGGQADSIVAALTGLELGRAEWTVAGQNQEMDRSLQSLQMALALAVFLVYVIMASTFESMLHPFVILFSVPLALVGVVGALALTTTPITIVVLIGGIVLAGVVVNNAIVLVDTINRMRATGVDRDEAIATAARLRLRPILITTLTTVLGLLPLALGVGEGAEIQQPLAVTVIAGLSSSTLLTLAVIPVIYLLFTRRVFVQPAEET